MSSEIKSGRIKPALAVCFFLFFFTQTRAASSIFLERGGGAAMDVIDVFGSNKCLKSGSRAFQLSGYRGVK